MSVKSAKRVMQILDLLLFSEKGLTEKEISEKLEIPASSTFNILQTMLEEEYVRRDYFRKYQLGAKIISLGNKAREELDLYHFSLPYLSKLGEVVNETVFLAYPHNQEMIYLAKIDCYHSIRTSAQPGANKPMYCTGLGKACLSALSEEEVIKLMSEIPYEQFTPYTVKNLDQLMKQLKQFKEQGYAVDDQENEIGLYCIAAPIKDANHKMIAAVSAAGPKERMVDNKDIVTKVKNAAYLISKSMGY